MHNYFKKNSSFAYYVFPRFKSNIAKIQEKSLSITKHFTSANLNIFSTIINKNECYPSSSLNLTNTKRIQASLSKQKKNQLIKTSRKHFYERKSLKWYWREKTYDMLDGDIYKNYLIKFKNNFHMELIPQSLSDNNSYDCCLIWLYDGDFPEYFIEHLLEFNNFPPKVIPNLSFKKLKK